MLKISYYCSTLLLGTALALCAAPAIAQQAPAAPKPAAAAGAAPKPSKPAPAANAPAASAAPAPLRVDLQGQQQSGWTKVCGRDEAAKKDICYTTRDFGQSADQPPVMALAVYDIKGEDIKIVRMLLPVSLLLRSGVRYNFDNDDARIEGAFEICFPNGCFAESRINAKVFERMRNATTLNLVVRNQANAEVQFVIPLDKFRESFDGPAIDPKVLEAQQKALEEQLRKRAEDERKKLEGQQNAPGGAPQTPPAAK